MKSQLPFLFLLCCSSLFAESFQEELPSLNVGFLVIYELPQSIVAVSVAKKDSAAVTLHCVTATKDVLEREKIASWMTWCQKGYPAASLHESVTLSLSDATALRDDPSLHYAWLRTLFTLDREKIPEEERKKAGPPPMPGEHDLRSPWQPRVTVDGKKTETVSTAYKVHWPKDGSPLEQRDIILYFPKTEDAVKGLPYWIESPSSSYRIFVIDSTRSFYEEKKGEGKPSP